MSYQHYAIINISNQGNDQVEDDNVEVQNAEEVSCGARVTFEFVIVLSHGEVKSLEIALWEPGPFRIITIFIIIAHKCLTVLISMGEHRGKVNLLTDHEKDKWEKAVDGSHYHVDQEPGILEHGENVEHSLEHTQENNHCEYFPLEYVEMMVVLLVIKDDKEAVSNGSD